MSDNTESKPIKFTTYSVSTHLDQGTSVDPDALRKAIEQMHKAMRGRLETEVLHGLEKRTSTVDLQRGGLRDSWYDNARIRFYNPPYQVDDYWGKWTTAYFAHMAIPSAYFAPTVMPSAIPMLTAEDLKDLNEDMLDLVHMVARTEIVVGELEKTWERWMNAAAPIDKMRIPSRMSVQRNPELSGILDTTLMAYCCLLAHPILEGHNALETMKDFQDQAHIFIQNNDTK
jgi:hypothetical protein